MSKYTVRDALRDIKALLGGESISPWQNARLGTFILEKKNNYPSLQKQFFEWNKKNNKHQKIKVRDQE